MGSGPRVPLERVLLPCLVDKQVKSSHIAPPHLSCEVDTAPPHLSYKADSNSFLSRRGHAVAFLFRMTSLLGATIIVLLKLPHFGTYVSVAHGYRAGHLPPETG